MVASLRKGQQNEVEIWVRHKAPYQPNRKVVVLTENEKLMINRIIVSENLRGAHKLVSYTNKILSKGKPDAYGRLIILGTLRWTIRC
jgi:hypothetical protein